MSVAASPATVSAVFDERIASVVSDGLTRRPKRLPAWLFYDAKGSRLFDAITQLPEYYLTRTERSIFAAHAEDMIREASAGRRVRLTELGAGSADKTRLLLEAATQSQGAVIYEPVDVSFTALKDARNRIQREIPEVTVVPRVMDYTDGEERRIHFNPCDRGERRMVLYIGSSIGNFEPHEAQRLLSRVRAGLSASDTLLLGVDLAKDKTALVAAYNDSAGVTAQFNRNLLVRLNRELDADFEPEAFEHRADWNAEKSRMEMHLVSQSAQRVHLHALKLSIGFAAGESIHTENSYKYRPGGPEAMLSAAGFTPVNTWTDAQGWFAVCLARAE